MAREARAGSRMRPAFLRLISSFRRRPFHVRSRSAGRCAAFPGLLQPFPTATNRARWIQRLGHLAGYRPRIGLAVVLETLARRSSAAGAVALHPSRAETGTRGRPGFRARTGSGAARRDDLRTRGQHLGTNDLAAGRSRSRPANVREPDRSRVSRSRAISSSDGISK